MIDFEKIDLLSYEITKNLSKLEIKSNGIYFTPIPIIKICIDKIKSIEKEYKLTIKNILEPCCGSCQFILMLDEHVSKKKIVGVEKNTKIIEKTRDIQLKNNEYRHVQDDFFHYNERENEKFDLIIGNPPFYVINKKNISEKYYKYLDGRPNIYNLFIIDCLKKLNKNGLLCFVLPTNFLNCLYYDTLRNYIKNKYKIHDIILIKENYFLTTKQDVFVLMIENKLSPNKNKDFCYSFSSNTIFHTPTEIEKIKKFTNGCTFLNKLNFRISIGTVTWNENKNILTDDDTETLIIYNNYLKNNEIEVTPFKNAEKKNYIKKKGENKPIIIINRGYGMGKYKFQYAFLNTTQHYLVENHCLTLEYMGDNNIEAQYRKIMESFNDIRTREFVEYYFKNNALNCEEVMNTLPIYLKQ